MTAPLHPDDQLLFAYLDGDLTPEHELELEYRLADDPELAQRCEELARWEARLLRHAEAASHRTTPARGRFWLAAAAVAMAFTSTWLVYRQTLPAPVAFRVAVLAGDATSAEYQQRLGHGGLLQEGLRGEAQDAEAAQDALRVLSEAVQSATRSDLDRGTSAVRSGYYYLAIEAAEPVSVVAVRFPDTGPPARVFPPGVDPGAARLAGGRAHLLPREPFRSAQNSSPFEPGYLLSRSERRAEVLCAVRREAIATPLLDELDASLKEGSRAEIEQWLEGQGFQLSTVSVQLP